jgi:hypothetical protein
MPGIPKHRGWLSGNAPLAIKVVTTGAPIASAKRISSLAARAFRTPPPT